MPGKVSMGTYLHRDLLQGVLFHIKMAGIPNFNTILEGRNTLEKIYQKAF